MAKDQLERRLIAILAADVAGYSRLTGLDEEGTHLQLREHFCSLVDPKIVEHRGRIVKNTGDGLLAEFGSVIEAVRCAVDVQRGMAQRNLQIPPDRRIEFRIGVNVGDIIVDRGDIFGDGVNIAARLEGLAEAGGVALSDDAYRQVRGKLGITIEDLGEHQLKNIAQDVRVYRVAAERIIAEEQPAATRGPTFGEILAHSNMTIRVPLHFLGRDDALAEIEQAVAREKGRLAIIALHGLRGVGKTTLAAAYADNHAGDYRAIWWIRAQTALSMRADLVGIGTRLGWVRADAKVDALSEEAIFATVMERMQHDGEGILLIYDNRAVALARLESVYIREKTLGSDHPLTAESLGHLAYLLQAQGDLVGAMPLFERALAIREEALGPEHPDTARSLNTLARLFQAQGELTKARPLMERALAIREKMLGPEHGYTANSLTAVAGLLSVQGDFAAARPLHERALAIREKALGPDHPDTAMSLASLGRLCQAQGDLDGARSLYERALLIREKSLGPDHPDTVMTQNELATLLTRGG